MSVREIEIDDKIYLIGPDVTDLGGMYIEDLDFSGEDLKHAYFGDATFHRVSFEGADLYGADFENANVKHVDFDGADLSYAYFKRADLRYAILSNVDLGDADLTGADLRHTVFYNANLVGTDLTNVKINDMTHFEGAKFDDFTMPDSNDIKYETLLHVIIQDFDMKVE